MLQGAGRFQNGGATGKSIARLERGEESKESRTRGADSRLASTSLSATLLPAGVLRADLARSSTMRVVRALLRAPASSAARSCFSLLPDPM
jgi:hypothetical protein